MYLQVLFHRLRWLHAPAAVLMVLLQRTPVLRLLTSAAPGFGLQSGELLKSAFVLAVLGAYDSVAGATSFNATVVAPTTVNPASGGAGASFTAKGGANAAFSVAFNVTGAPSTTKSWRVVGTLPAGVAVTGATAITGGFIVDGLKVTIAGTPTVAASQSLTITAYDVLKGSQASTNNKASITCVLSVIGANAPPVFTAQPATQTVNAGTNVTFTAVVTGTPTPTLQWFKGTTLLTGKTAASLSLPAVTAADAGDYKLVATNSSAPAGVPSTVATLTVNTPPVFTSAATALFQALQTGQTFTVVATGKPAPTFSATGLPAWAALNPTTGVISGTPTTAQAGATTVTLAASNGVGPAVSQSFSLVVKTALRLWQETNFTALELADPAVSGPAAVIAPDGLPNLIHHALGYGPRQTVPSSALAFAQNASAWTLAYTRPTAMPGLAYQVETSADLSTWTTAGVTHQLVSSTGGVDSWRGSVPAGPARVFLRLKVAEQ